MEIKPYAFEIAKDLLNILGKKPSSINATKLVCMILDNIDKND